MEKVVKLSFFAIAGEKAAAHNKGVEFLSSGRRTGGNTRRKDQQAYHYLDDFRPAVYHVPTRKKNFILPCDSTAGKPLSQHKHDNFYPFYSAFEK